MNDPVPDPRRGQGGDGQAPSAEHDQIEAIDLEGPPYREETEDGYGPL